MINNFIQLLANPLSGDSLVHKNNVLKDTISGEEFKYAKNVAILLPVENIETSSSPLHQKLDTQFNYQEHYQKDAEIFSYFNKKLDKATKHENRRLHEVIFNKIDKNSNCILDVGCGEAWIAQKALSENIKVISMDISTINPQNAVNQYPSPNHLGLVADAFHLPLKENSVDTIIASEIMEHVSEPDRFVLSLFKRLRPKGKLIITTPYNENLEYSLCIHCNNPTPRHAHIHSFNEQNIQKLIPKNCIWNYYKFSNVFLTQLRTHMFFTWMPHLLWKAIDKMANFITKKPKRLLIEITKKE